MRRFTYIPLVLMVSAAMPVFAWAATDIDVRASIQDGFVRFVFSGEGVSKVDVTTKGKDSLAIKFDQAVNAKGFETATDGIKPPMKLAKDGDASFNLGVDGGYSRFRTLVLGKRLFVDVYTPQKPEQGVGASMPSSPAESGPQAQATIKPHIDSSVVVEDMTKKPSEAVVAKPENATGSTAEKEVLPLPENAALQVMPSAVDALKPADPTPEKPFTGSAIITVGSTQGVSLAAFEREGYLWIVVSQENMSVQPVVSGPDAAALGDIDAFPIDGGSAYRLKMPKGASIRPEGGGLVWRLFVTGKGAALRSVTVDRDFSDIAEGPKAHIPLQLADSVLRLPDPVMGDDLAVVTVARADARLMGGDKYVDFDVIPAVVGAVLRPKADGIKVSVLPNQVTVMRQGGLRISAAGPRRNVALAENEGDAPKTDDARGKLPSRVYKMSDWSLGGPQRYLDSRRLLDINIAAAEDTTKINELINAAKFMFAQGMPHEALGFINMALSFMPLLRDLADFQSLKGGAHVLAGQHEEGMAALSSAGLEGNDEVNLWKAFSLAQTGKLTESQKLIPDTAKSLIVSYPDRVQAMMLPDIIDAVLARGDVTLASSLVDIYEKASRSSIAYLDSPLAVTFFRGKIALLRGEGDVATNYFREAADGVIGPYPLRATLALAERGVSAKTIAREDAVNKLERFRYAWRGDALEIEMLQRLGLIYVTGGEQRLGLTILRDAATLAPEEALREKLVSVMQKAFKELFSGKTKEKMSPLEAAAVAAEFAELMPAGGDGEDITLNIADKMMAVDLLDRAASLIEPMIDRTESMERAVKYAQQAAAIRITDNRPEDALRDIDKALSRPDVQGQTALDPKILKSFALLRAKAKQQQKRIDAAFVELNSVPEDADVLRLKADIAWSSQKWGVAADALGKLVRQSNMDATRPPTRDQAQMLLNLALAYNLSGKTSELDDLRLTYGDIMRRTELQQPFLLVTRTAREAKLADRTTLLKLVSEVNMFKDVLDGYKTPVVTQKSAISEPANGQTDRNDQKQIEPGQQGNAG